MEFSYGARLCRDLSFVMCFIPHFSNLISFTHIQWNKKIIYVLLWISGLIFLFYGNCNSDLWVFSVSLEVQGSCAWQLSLITCCWLTSLQNFSVQWTSCLLQVTCVCMPPPPKKNIVTKYLHFTAVHWTQPSAFWLTGDWNNREWCTDCCRVKWCEWTRNAVFQIKSCACLNKFCIHFGPSNHSKKMSITNILMISLPFHWHKEKCIV